MIVEVRVYDSRKALAEGERAINSFRINDENHHGRRKLAKTAWWAARNGKCLVTWPMPGQPQPRQEN